VRIVATPNGGVEVVVRAPVATPGTGPSK
jgi:hypothetical protein